MKFKLLYFSFALLLGAVLFQSSSLGRAKDAGEGNTGAPGDDKDVCQSCHNSNSIQTTATLTLRDTFGNVVTAYAPTQIYDLTVTINTAKGNPLAWGFQCVTLKDAGNLPYNAWSKPGNNVQLTSLNTGRQYAEHIGPGNSNEFTVQWTAPEVGTGSITFYAGGNGVNLDMHNTGDGGTKTKITVTEGAVLGSKELHSNLSFDAFPNPVISSTQLIFPEATKANGSLQILNMNGQIIASNGQTIVAGTKEFTLDMSQFCTGLYLIRYQSESGNFTKRVVRL
ncbi:MAG: choice-of-anchor V domain-containing protein [Saprospiraceae bacterium]